MTDLSTYYQLPEDIAPAGTASIENDLIDYSTGVNLVDGDSQENLTGETLETIVAVDGRVYPIIVANEVSNPVTVEITNQKTSEVSTSLLGIPRSEVALNLFDTVNIYGVNSKEWAGNPNVPLYQYWQDPSDWTFAGNYGYFTRHLSAESAIQAYVYLRPKSYTYSFDDNSGRYPGGYGDGVSGAKWYSKRVFRYQPGRVTGFTMGVRMSTDSGQDGEVIQWGCQNDYGDGYYFQLEKGTDLYIIRTSPGLGTLKVAREDWNGDPIFVNEGITKWSLDLSRVTMFKIEYSWYGAVGAKFLAYVPAGYGEARWVTLHYISAENQFTQPSLRSAYLRMFTYVTSVAGAKQPAFINLYGSSVYIDGGDKGTVTIGTAAQPTAKPIGPVARSMVGLNIKGTINNVSNQKAVYPVSMAASSSADTRFDLVLVGNTCGGVQFGYGAGTSLSRASNGTTISVVRTGTYTLSGVFPDLSAEVSGSTNYLSGRRVKVTGAGLYATHVTAINGALNQITVDQPIPDGTTSIGLSRFEASATSAIAITNGVTSGTIYRHDDAGFWRLGLMPRASGVYNGTQNVVWFASSYPRKIYNYSTNTYYEDRLPVGFGACNEATSFTVLVDSGTTTSTISAGGNSLVVSGTTNPWPIAVVAEMLHDATISDVTIAEGNSTLVLTPGSGATREVSAWTVSGLTQSSAAAGGTDYAAHKFEDALCDPLSAVLVDRQGSKAISTVNKLATFFIGSGQTEQFDLSHVFGPDKMFITGPPGSDFNTGALFVVATARTGSGLASVTLNWEEQ
jgi:hypothetical protein